MEEVIHLLIQSRDYSHFRHWNDRLLGRHLALGEYYENVVPLVDRLAEVYMGYDGTIAVPDAIKVPYGTDPREYFTRISNALDGLIRNVAREDIKNILAETLELVNHTLYKLSLEKGYLKVNAND